MKKAISLTLAIVLIFALSATPAFAASTTTIKANVPMCGYVMTIPKDCTATFGVDELDLGSLKFTGCTGFCEGKYINVTVTCTELATTQTSVQTGADNIPYTLECKEVTSDGTSMKTANVAPGSGGLSLAFDPNDFDSEDKMNTFDFSIIFGEGAWASAKPADYTATITFSGSIVNNYAA